jgi:hypothetical protein
MCIVSCADSIEGKEQWSIKPGPFPKSSRVPLPVNVQLSMRQGLFVYPSPVDTDPDEVKWNPVTLEL